MNIGKITKKIGELSQNLGKSVVKKTQQTQGGKSLEISSQASKAARSYGLSGIIFKKTGTPEGDLKINLRKYLSFLKENSKENYFSVEQNSDSPRKVIKEILSVVNDRNIALANTLLRNPGAFNWRKTHILNMLGNIEDEKTAQELSALFKKYFSTCAYKENSDSFFIILKSLEYTKTKDSPYTKELIKAITSWLDDPTLVENFRLNYTFNSLLFMAPEKPQEVETMIAFVKQVAGQNGYFKKNLEFLNQAGNIFDIYRPKTMEARKQFLDDILNKRISSQRNIGLLLSDVDEENIDIVRKCTTTPLLADNTLFDINSGEIYRLAKVSEQGKFIREMLDEYINTPALAWDDRMKNHIAEILKSAKDPEHIKNIKAILEYCKKHPEAYKSNIGAIMEFISPKNSAFVWEYLSQSRLYQNTSLQAHIGQILEKITKNPDSEKLIKETLETYFSKPELKNIDIGAILSEIEPEKIPFVKKYFETRELYENIGIRTSIRKILKNYRPETQSDIEKLIDEFLQRPELKDIRIEKLLQEINKDNFEFIEQFISDPILYKSNLLNAKLDYILSSYYRGKLDFEGLKKVIKNLDKETMVRLQDNIDVLFTISKFSELHEVTNLNQLTISGKRRLLRNLISSNSDLFTVSKVMGKENYPLIPATKDEYCKLIPSLVKSIGIQTKRLSAEEISRFNTSMFGLSEILSKISDEDFANLKIKQKHSLDEFIASVLNKTQTLNTKERQKVFDYFGFDILPCNTNKNGYTIVGYPVNLNNGTKLAEINEEATREVIECVRKLVVEFNEENEIEVNNPTIQKLLNEIVSYVPELRTMIGKSQHETHNFDLMQHSLKVMAKIAQNKDFKTLSESDKKITLIASLLHDITKFEGKVTKLHANESAFDSFYIAKKFDLSQEEEAKLYKLIKHHEWLAFANKQNASSDELTRLQSIAYDLQSDNIFKMAKIFTEADLKAVKKDDYYYTSYRADFERHSRKIEELIEDLRTTQPLLPVTKFPSADKIARAITKVNPDMSTNIKGLYKTKKGLIVIKFNEVTDWEALGFPKGTTSRGIKTLSETDKKPINTGNIKFFVHGLDSADQLIKFDAFALPDSDALLSLSYSERPESKYRFFRTQGVILDVNTNNVHGGGNTDAGSGCKKTIDTFKNNYIFGGDREEDRRYVANLIKQALHLSDEEYIKFVQKHKNKSMLEIEPERVRNKLIRAMAQIDSSLRHGDRKYNEMYGTNPKIMATFGYSADDNVGNICDFLEREEIQFLEDYSIENNIPLVIFGD